MMVSIDVGGEKKVMDDGGVWILSCVQQQQAAAHTHPAKRKGKKLAEPKETQLSNRLQRMAQAGFV